jgi:hypothetical protein
MPREVAEVPEVVAPQSVAIPASTSSEPVTVATGQTPHLLAIPSPLPRSIQTWFHERERAAQVETVTTLLDLRTAATTPITPTQQAIQAASAQTASAPASASMNGDQANGSPSPSGRASAEIVSIALVLDCSGSMGHGQRLAQGRRAVLAAWDRLHPESQVSVVVYKRKAEPLLSGFPISANGAGRVRVESALHALEASGESDHTAGIRLALKYRPQEVILFTDAGDEELVDVAAVLRSSPRPIRYGVRRIGDSR